ncbi:MAG: chlorite dismutase family protein [Chloroflexi bacterium]|nr:chlorite dismutase family protein [Chloroflexota bacterium]
MAQAQQRHYIKYSFFKTAPEWRRLPAAERRTAGREFLEVATSFAEEIGIHPYNLQGARGDADFMLWQIARRLESIQELAAALAGTGLGSYLSTPYSYLAMTRPSPYVEGHRHEGQEGAGATLRVKGARYLFVYPFVKTRPWYRLAAAERQRMMNEHFVIGHKYPSVKISTAYSFGLDDQEFVLGFETDKPEDFLDLVMELRESEASGYTLRDTPIFTCVAMPLKEVLASLGA